VANTGSQRMGGMFSPIIPRNSTVPVSRTEVYSTTGDQQRIVDIKVYQGESRLVKNNTFLDSYSIDGIPPAPAGHEKVAITFTYDVNGILNVKTKIVSTGKEAALVVDKSAQRMSDADKGKAKERLDGEWKGEKPATGDRRPATGDEQIIVAAKAKMGSVDAANRAKLEKLIADFAVADTANKAKIDRELTNLLFELD
jgi:molecular chaperone DnaK